MSDLGVPGRGRVRAVARRDRRAAPRRASGPGAGLAGGGGARGRRRLRHVGRERASRTTSGSAWRCACSPLRRRDDAADAAVVAALDDAAMIFFSGWEPLASGRDRAATHAVLGASARPHGRRARLRGLQRRGRLPQPDRRSTATPTTWTRSSSRGSGTSAGCCSPRTGTPWTPGSPGATGVHRAVGRPTDEVLVGLDERTAMVGDGREWQVHGLAGVHLRRDGDWGTPRRPGSSFALALAVGARDGEPVASPTVPQRTVLTRERSRSRRARRVVIERLYGGVPGRDGRAALLEPARVPDRHDPVGAVHRREGERGHRRRCS